MYALSLQTYRYSNHCSLLCYIRHSSGVNIVQYKYNCLSVTHSPHMYNEVGHWCLNTSCQVTFNSRTYYSLLLRKFLFCLPPSQKLYQVHNTSHPNSMLFYAFFFCSLHEFSELCRYCSWTHKWHTVCSLLYRIGHALLIYSYGKR